MIITAARFHPYRLPLRDPWISSSGGFAWREGWLLRLESDDGRYGYGDCAPLTLMGTESFAQAKYSLVEQQRKILGRPLEEALSALNEAPQIHAPAARCALESALLDLSAQAADLPLGRYLASGSGDKVRVNAALGSLLLVSDQAILKACAEGFSVLKLKVGSAPLGDELARLQHIVALLPLDTQLRLDANGAWSEIEAMRFIKHCADLPIEMLEEPLAAPDPQSLRRLQSNCPFPLALDESWPDFAATYAGALPVRRLVLKPPRLGGLQAALTLARHASAAGLECVVTSSIDSACGVMAAAQLAAALDNGLAHGLATSCWLAEDLGSAPLIQQGNLKLPDTPGLGFMCASKVGFHQIKP